MRILRNFEDNPKPLKMDVQAGSQLMFMKTYVASLIASIFASISIIPTLDDVSKVISIAIAISLAIYARRKYLQDMKNKKIDEAIKLKQLENETQLNYQLMEKSKAFKTPNNDSGNGTEERKIA